MIVDDARRRIVIRIIDAGPGLREDVRDHVFQPFFSTKPRGSGLGLALAHAIVKSHRGIIDIRNGSSTGALVEIIFPAA